MSGAVEEYTTLLAQHAVAQAAAALDIDYVEQEVLDVLADCLLSYMGRLASKTTCAAQAGGRSVVNILDAIKAAQVSNVKLEDLEDFLFGKPDTTRPVVRAGGKAGPTSNELLLWRAPFGLSIENYPKHSHKNIPSLLRQETEEELAPDSMYEFFGKSKDGKRPAKRRKTETPSFTVDSGPIFYPPKPTDRNSSTHATISTTLTNQGPSSTVRSSLASLPAIAAAPEAAGPAAPTPTIVPLAKASLAKVSKIMEGSNESGM